MTFGEKLIVGAFFYLIFAIVFCAIVGLWFLVQFIRSKWT